jgi:hypothetical protein
VVRRSLHDEGQPRSQPPVRVAEARDEVAERIAEHEAGHTGAGVDAPEQIQGTADAVGEESIVSRTGGAPTLAVGLAGIMKVRVAEARDEVAERIAEHEAGHTGAGVDGGEDEQRLEHDREARVPWPG